MWPYKYECELSRRARFNEVGLVSMQSQELSQQIRSFILAEFEGLSHITHWLITHYALSIPETVLDFAWSILGLSSRQCLEVRHLSGTPKRKPASIGRTSVFNAGLRNGAGTHAKMSPSHASKIAFKFLHWLGNVIHEGPITDAAWKEREMVGKQLTESSKCGFGGSSSLQCVWSVP